MTAISTWADRMNEISTPRIVTMCEPRRPTVLPNRPAMMDPASGASGTHSKVDCESVDAMSVAPPHCRLPLPLAGEGWGEGDGARPHPPPSPASGRRSQYQNRGHDMFHVNL